MNLSLEDFKDYEVDVYNTFNKLSENELFGHLESLKMSIYFNFFKRKLNIMMKFTKNI